MDTLLVNWIETQIQAHPNRPPLLFVSGAQGIGKSTALGAVKRHFSGGVAVLGLDDFYLTHAERQSLAKAVHPLFSTRGPPGTHDIGFLSETIDALSKADELARTKIPVFDKRTDDRAPEADWTLFEGRPAAIILEGWLIGAEPDTGSPVAPALNRVEAQDPEGAWRSYQEAHLAGDYGRLWDRADAYFHMLAPSFETVLAWRTQQEETTLGLVPGTLPVERREWVETFILHYERLTRRMLDGGRRAGAEVRVDSNRKPVAVSGLAVQPPPFIVFSDLDGTLLDHGSYSFEAARPALEAIQQHGGMLVLASSKTAAEIADLRAQMGFVHCPAIVENGGGLLAAYQAAEDLDQKDAPYQRLIEGLNCVPPALRMHYASFSDWSVEEVARQTGLPINGAAKAKARAFSEPGLWTGSDAELSEFEAALADQGISMRRGGRFLTLSFGATKADQMDDIVAHYCPEGGRPATIALGDAPNDVEMIEHADKGVIIANPYGSGIGELAAEKGGDISRTVANGPEGWNLAVLDFIEKQVSIPTPD